MAMCAIPELMPNKYRHIGICISDGFIYIIVVIGPIVGRVSEQLLTIQSKTNTGDFYSMRSTQETEIGSTSTG